MMASHGFSESYGWHDGNYVHVLYSLRLLPWMVLYLIFVFVQNLSTEWPLFVFYIRFPPSLLQRSCCVEVKSGCLCWEFSITVGLCILCCFRLWSCCCVNVFNPAKHLSGLCLNGAKLKVFTSALPAFVWPRPRRELSLETSTQAGRTHMLTHASEYG